MKSSRGEIKICDILDAAGLVYKEEYSFPDLISTSGRPLRFDFCVFDDNGDIDFLIEYQGIQHYSYNASWKCSKDAFEDGQIRDNLKREYCIKNSINLIEIPYWDFNKINYEYIKEKIGQ